MEKLAPKQQIFADEYLIDLNATRAYKVAYKSCKKDEAASVNGCKLLRNAKVAVYIDKRMKERSERTAIDQDRVLQELAAIGFANITDFVTTDGHNVEIKNTAEIEKNKLGAIAGIKWGANGIEVKLNSKEKALELIGRHLGMWNDKVELSGNVNMSNPFEGLTTEQLIKLAGDEDG